MHPRAAMYPPPAQGPPVVRGHRSYSKESQGGTNCAGAGTGGWVMSDLTRAGVLSGQCYQGRERQCEDSVRLQKHLAQGLASEALLLFKEL